MVGKFVELENGKVVIKPICYHTKPLRDIIDFFPDSYDRIIHYLHCMISLNPHDNPFADLDEAEKEEKILRYLNLDVDMTNPIVKEGHECMYDCYATTVYRTYEALKRLQDGINADLKDMRLTYSKESGNSANVMAVVKNLAIVKKELKEAKKDYLEEQGDVRGRGGVEMAYDETDVDEDDDLIDDYDDEDDDDLD